MNQFAAARHLTINVTQASEASATAREWKEKAPDGFLVASVRVDDATEPVAQLRWGLPAAVLVLMSLIIKLAVAPTIHHNRLMRELKRIELQIARMRK